MTAAQGKLALTLVRRADVDDDAFEHSLLHDLPPAVADALPAGVRAAVTLLRASEYSGARVRVDGAERSVDALLEIWTDEPFVALDPLLGMLGERFAHVQGWWVRPTTIYDGSEQPPLGEPSAMPAQVVFVRRKDGTTPEHFDRNWYIHAGHLDGKEGVSPASDAEAAKDLAAIPGGRYVQNRVLEAVTPTSWVVHGYTQLLLPMFVPSLEGSEPYDRERGEEDFDRWPPRLLQGHEHRVV